MSEPTCELCGAPVRWAYSPMTRRRVPFDPQPSEQGTYELLEEGPTLSRGPREVAAYVPPAGRTGEGPEKFRPHYYSCRELAKWRAKRG